MKKGAAPPRRNLSGRADAEQGEPLNDDFSTANVTNAKWIALPEETELIVSRPCAETSHDSPAKGRAQ
jgi:hypothetical protein